MNPFWCYYGGKFRAAPRYPPPFEDTIVEPFAGAAGYSTRYPSKHVILVEKYHKIAAIWRYLIGVSPEEIMRIPIVDALCDLPAWVPEGARYLIGFCFNDASVTPMLRISAGMRRARDGYYGAPQKIKGWSEARRARVARDVVMIKHWQIIEGDYTSAPDVRATWFVDPPYNNRAGKTYHHAHEINYTALGEWCRARRGQTIVCENEGADWLPFRPFAELHACNMTSSGEHKAGKDRISREVIWTQYTNPSPTGERGTRLAEA